MIEAARSAIQRGNRLQVVRLRKHIDQLQSMKAVAGLYQCREISSQRRRIARDIYDTTRVAAGQQITSINACSHTRRVEQNEIGRRSATLSNLLYGLL